MYQQKLSLGIVSGNTPPRDCIREYTTKGVYQEMFFVGSVPGNTLLGLVSANTVPRDCIREYTTNGVYQEMLFLGTLPRKGIRKHSQGDDLRRYICVTIGLKISKMPPKLPQTPLNDFKLLCNDSLRFMMYKLG